MSLVRLPFPPDELRVLAELTVELVKLRQNECKHLCVENVGPEIWKALLVATYAFEPLFAALPNPTSGDAGG